MFGDLTDPECELSRVYEAEGAFSLSLTREGRIQPEAIWELKAGMLKKSGLLQLHRSTEGFESLGGLKALKTFCKRSLLRPHRDNPLAMPRGVLLLGVPGTGKSAFCKALEIQPRARVLQIGTGSGYVAAVLAQEILYGFAHGGLGGGRGRGNGGGGRCCGRGRHRNRRRDSRRGGSDSRGGRRRTSRGYYRVIEG